MLLASVMPIMLIIIMLTTGAFLAQKWADPIGIFVDEYYADLLFNTFVVGICFVSIIGISLPCFTGLTGHRYIGVLCAVVLYQNRSMRPVRKNIYTFLKLKLVIW